MLHFNPLPVGTVLESRYELVADCQSNKTSNQHLLGSGGFGAVYLAHDLILKREVAIKQSILLKEKNSQVMFRREAQLLANLSHPALPKVLHFFSDEESCFIVMDLIQGDDLEEQVNRSGNLPFAAVRDIALQLFEVLDYLHGHSIIHKDIKPANLKYTGGQLKLLDFGFAKGSVGLMSEHKETIVRGLTPAWAPPEQMEFEPSTPQSDLYSASATLYFLASGVAPPDANLRATEIAIQGNDLITSLHNKDAEVPEWFAGIINEGLSLSMENRPSSAAAMKERLENELLPTLRPAVLGTNPPIKKLPRIVVPTQVATTPTSPQAADGPPPATGPKTNIPFLRGATRKQIRLLFVVLLLGAIVVVLPFSSFIRARYYVMQANACFARNDDKCAIENYSNAIGLQPDNFQAHFDRGRAYYHTGRYHEAIADYTEYIKGNDRDAAAYFNLGLAYHSLSNYAEAIAHFTKAIGLKPDYSEAYFNRGLGYNSLESFDGAITDFTKAIELKPDYSEPYSNRGRAYNNLGSYDKAIEDCTKAIALKSDNSNAYFSRAFAYYYRKRYHEAIADYTEHIKNNTEDDGAYYNRGLAFYNLGSYDEAITDFTKAIELDSNTSKYFLMRELSLLNKEYLNKDELATARADREKVRELAKKHQ